MVKLKGELLWVQQIPHEEFLDSILSHEKQPPFSHGHKPPVIDNNIWNHFPKMDLNKFDGSNPNRWVSQMEYYFSLHGIIDDMIKLKEAVLYLDPERWK